MAIFNLDYNTLRESICNWSRLDEVASLTVPGRAMDDYKPRMQYAADADEKAADYLKQAAWLLQK